MTKSTHEGHSDAIDAIPDRLFDAVVTMELRRLSVDAADDTGVSLLTGRMLGNGR